MYKDNSVSRFMVAIVVFVIAAVWLVCAGVGAVSKTNKIVKNQVNMYSVLDSQIADVSVSNDSDAPSPILTEESGAPTLQPDEAVIKEGASTTPVKPLALGFLVLLGTFISITIYLNKKYIK